MAALLGFGGSLAGTHSCFRRGAAPCPSVQPATSVRRDRVSLARVVAAEEAAPAPAPADRRKPSRAADFRSLNDSQIDEEVQKSKRELFNLRIAQRTKQVSGEGPAHLWLEWGTFRQSWT